METTLIQKLVKELQCPTCSTQMIAPLTHCNEGHHYCNKCIAEKGHCEICQTTMGSRRNYSLEKLCFTYLLKCSFAPGGCSFTGTCVVVAEHERCCQFAQSLQNFPTTSTDAICSIGDSEERSLEEALFAELECPVCYFVMSPLVGECHNGHGLCEECFEFVENCPICRSAKTFMPNIVLMKIFSMMLLSCRNAPNGCEESGNAPFIVDHEFDCKFALSSCPLTVDGHCKWQGPICHLVEHCKSTHADKLTQLKDYKCCSGKLENQLSHHNLFYVDGVLFRFGWDVIGNVYRFSVNYIDNSLDENRYWYEVKVFGHNPNHLVMRMKALCASLADGSDKSTNSQSLQIPQEQVMKCLSKSGGITYSVRIMDGI